jgi:hypothetical protein
MKEANFALALTADSTVPVADVILHEGWVLKKRRKKMQGEIPGVKVYIPSDSIRRICASLLYYIPVWTALLLP